MLEYQGMQFCLLLQSHRAYVYGGMVDKFNINISSVTVTMSLCNSDAQELFIFLRQCKVYFLFFVCVCMAQLPA